MRRTNNKKLDSILEEAARRRNDIEAERDALQAKRDQIGVEILDCNEALRALDRFLGREPADTDHNRVIPMRRREIAQVPVEHAPPPKTLTEAVRVALDKGPCLMRELEARVAAMSSEFNVKSVNGTVHALVGRGVVKTWPSEGERRRNMYGLVGVQAAG